MTREPIEDCKTAALHLIGRIQAYGVLLTLDQESGHVLACSSNVATVLDQDPDRVIGRHWSAFFPDTAISLRDGEEESAGVPIPHVRQTALAGRSVVVLSHVRNGVVTVEIEPLHRDVQETHRERLVFLQELSDCQKPEDAAGLLLKHIAEIVGFDRHMLYRFMPDWHGMVIDENKKPDIDGFLGLHFPAGDIPENARRLYTVNLQRFIADVNGDVADIVAADPGHQMELTHAQLRAVHPVHIQYLKNMGVRTSFSVSIVVSGQLWGMVACHDMKPTQVSFQQRFLCEELARIVALHMAGLLAQEADRRKSDLDISLSLLEKSLQSGHTGGEALSTLTDELMSSFEADGLWTRIGDRNIHRGIEFGNDEFLRLSQWIADQRSDEVWHTDEIPPALETYPQLVQHASALLLIPLEDHGFIALMRNERIQNLEWAVGNAPENDQMEADSELAPRASFEAWSEQVRGKGVPWSDIELMAAASLREMLMTSFEKAELEHMALKDGVTGLANRRQFERELDEALERNETAEPTIAVLMLDLDKFKLVNDRHGHDAGDELLIQVGERLQTLVRERDLVARFGGDEFAMLLYHVRGTGEVAKVAKRIIEEMQRPFHLNKAEVRISASVGIAMSRGQAITRQELMKNADIALYDVKRHGRDNYQFHGLSH